MSPRRFVLIVFPSLCLPTSGCGTFYCPGSALPPVSAASLPGEGLPAGALCASTTRAPDRVPRLLNPVERERPFPDASTTGSANRFGLRVSVLMTQETEAMQWNPGFRLGVYYRGTHPAVERLVCELGFDHMSVRGDDGEEERSLLRSSSSGALSCSAAGAVHNQAGRSIFSAAPKWDGKERPGNPQGTHSGLKVAASTSESASHRRKARGTCALSTRS